MFDSAAEQVPFHENLRADTHLRSSWKVFSKEYKMYVKSPECQQTYGVLVYFLSFC